MTNRKPIAAHSHNGNGKTYYFMKESDVQYSKNMSYLYNLEGKSIKNLAWTARHFFILQNDALDNEKSGNKVFDILTKNSKNKMAALSEIQKLISDERIKRKTIEIELKELKKKIKNA